MEIDFECFLKQKLLTYVIIVIWFLLYLSFISHFSNLFNDLDNVQMHEHHLLELLSGIIQWIDPPDAVSKAIECGKSERLYPCQLLFPPNIQYFFLFSRVLKFILVFFSEMLDGCRALLSIATVTTPSVFDQLLKSTRSVVEFLIIGCLVIIYIKVIVMMAFPVPCYLV